MSNLSRNLYVIYSPGIGQYVNATSQGTTPKFGQARLYTHQSHARQSIKSSQGNNARTSVLRTRNDWIILPVEATVSEKDVFSARLGVTKFVK